MRLYEIESQNHSTNTPNVDRGSSQLIIDLDAITAISEVEPIDNKLMFAIYVKFHVAHIAVFTEFVPSESQATFLSATRAKLLIAWREYLENQHGQKTAPST